ncbi:MAG: outer membrane beta-barrel protein [Cyclobacteriaceae bacterium]|jgi:hypothetical protein|nr:hypothetical protein [Flammeovirgaceae bacterium]
MSEVANQTLVMMLRAAFMIAVFFGSSWAVAQDVPRSSDDVELVLQQAVGEFNAGHFYGIPALLAPVLTQATNEQRKRGYLLLCQVYLIIDEPLAADSSYLSVLKADPEFIPTEKIDQIEVVYLSSKFTAAPVITPRFFVGLNGAFPTTVFDVNTFPTPVNTRSLIRPGWQLGVGIDLNVGDNVSLCAEGILAFRNFRRTYDGILGNDFQSAIHKQTWFDIPLYIKYQDDQGDIRPYGFAGMAFNTLLQYRAEVQLTMRTDGGSEVPVSGPDIALKSKQSLISTSFIIGGGVKYKWGKDFLFAEARYMGGLTRLANTNELYYGDGTTLAENITRYGWVGEEYAMNSVLITVGFMRPIYYPRKRSKGLKGIAKVFSSKKNEGDEK